jgi:hypothetical protein
LAWTYAKRTHSGVRHMGMYRYPPGRKRSAAHTRPKMAAAAAAARAEGKVAEGTWLDRSAGRILFEEYVTTRGGPASRRGVD